MGRLILTGLTKKKRHEFKLRYEVLNELEKCWADCSCGFSIEIKSFANYGGIKELERAWSGHVV